MVGCSTKKAEGAVSGYLRNRGAATKIFDEPLRFDGPATGENRDTRWWNDHVGPFVELIGPADSPEWKAFWERQRLPKSMGAPVGGIDAKLRP
jgi:hypothetical protein